MGWSGVDREREKEPSRLLEGRGRGHSLPLEPDFRRLIGVAAATSLQWNGTEREKERKRSFVTSSDALRDAASPLLSSPSESYVGEEGRDDGA